MSKPAGPVPDFATFQRHFACAKLVTDEFFDLMQRHLVEAGLARHDGGDARVFMSVFVLTITQTMRAAWMASRPPLPADLRAADMAFLNRALVKVSLECERAATGQAAGRA